MLTFCLSAVELDAAEERLSTTGYRVPPKAIADLADAPPTPDVQLGPKRDWMLILTRPGLPPITELAQPESRLAGLRLNPRTNGPSRNPFYTGLTLRRVADRLEREITGLPAECDGAPPPRINAVQWSPDGTRLAFIVTRERDIQLWVADVATGRARRILRERLNVAYGAAFHWIPDSKGLICRVIPRDRGSSPEPSSVPGSPIIQENRGKTAPARTYQDLLKNPDDEALFAHLLTAQVVRVSLRGQKALLGAADLIRRAEPSPDGRYFLVEILHRPFSYLVPAFRFPYRVEVWDRDGTLVRQIADRPLAEEVPHVFDAVPTGRRGFGWRGDAAATLYWTEAQDDGDPRRKAEVRDRVFLLPSPFEQPPVSLLSLGLRYQEIRWGNDHLALVGESWWQDRRQRTWVVRPDAPGDPPRLLFDRSWEDRYGDPGSPLMRPTATGRWLLQTSEGGDALFLVGDGASPEGDRPFLDRLDLETARSDRLWRSQAPYYERPVALLDDRGERLITRREAVDQPPNFYLRAPDDEAPSPLTAFPHPTPQLASVRKELIRYERADGVKLTATLYLPPAYSTADGPLPLLMWAYPQEFKSSDHAGQVTDSPYRFVRVGWGSPLPWLALGYAVLDDPTMPIVGEGEREPNDRYVEQLVASAAAAVEEVVRRGVAERERIAVGGHSYGAFMTANLLAHSDLFCAGIARSGAYNRTLTPFGFQAEERTLWEAPDVYVRMSPYMHADKIKEPILLIHGEADNNSGTFPMQSERFFNALKGHGATTRLVMLPLESHGYQARESVLHMLWEMTEWLERYVKRPS